MVKTVCG